MKICFVSEHSYPHIGGGEIIFWNYAKELAKRGHNVHILTSNSGAITGQFIKDNVTLHAFSWPLFFGHPVPQVRDMLPILVDCDIIHASTYTAGPAALEAAKKLNKPCMLTVYEALNGKWFWIENNPVKAFGFMLYERWILLRDYTFFHSISKATTKDLISAGIDEKKIITIYPGVDMEFVNKSQKTNSLNSKYFLYFGRPGQTKGVFLLLDAIYMIKNQLKGYKFKFVLGYDPLVQRKLFCDNVRKLELQNIVEVLEPITRVHAKKLVKIIRGAYCVIVPSVTEGFGFSAVETCSLGTPIIASNGGSLPEVIFGKTLQFKNRSKSDLSTKILMAISGKFVKLPAKSFNWGDSSESLLKVYRRCL